MTTGTQSSVTEKAVSPHQNDFLFDDRIKRIIINEVRFLLKTGLFQEYEKDDLKQELSIALWRAHEKYNSSHSNRYTFSKAVVIKKAQNMIDSASRRKNSGPQELISTDIVINEDGDTLQELISSDEPEMIEGRRSRSRQETSELIDSLNYAISLLPDEQKEICRAILDGETISSLAHRYGISRTAFRKRYLKSIRKVFVSAGMKDYC